MPELSVLTLFCAAMLLLFLCLLLFYRFDILEPAVLMTGTMALSAFAAAMTQTRWNLMLTGPGFFGLAGGMLAFTAGSIFCSWRSGAISTEVARPSVPQQARGGWQGWLIFTVLIVLMAIMAWQSYQEIYAASVAFGNTKGVLGILSSVRPAIESQQFTFSRWMSYRQMAAQTIAFVAVYIFLRHAILGPWYRRDLLLLITVPLYVPFMVFTTGRMAMMCFGIYILIIAAVLYERARGFHLRTNLRVLGAAVLFGMAVLGTFLLMGFLTGKGVGGDRTPFVILSHYIGLSIPAFGQVAAQPLPEDGYLFSNTLLSPYRALAHIFPGLPKVDTFLPFIYFEGIDTNVYTCVWRYLLDFGGIGMCAFMAMLGGGYTLAYHYVKYRTGSAFVLMLYATLAYPLFLSSIDERFLVDLAGTTPIYEALLLFIACRLLLRRKSS